MKRFFKIIAGTLALLITLSLVAVVVVVNIDPNNHKDFIAGKVKEQTGRELSLNGDITLSFYPWLGLRIEEVALSDDPAFSQDPFFSTSLAQVRIKLLPLLRGEYEIDTVRLHDTHLQLMVNAQGRGNWESLVPGDGEDDDARDDSSDEFSLPRVLIGGIDIRNFNLRYEDRSQDNTITLTNLQATTSELVLGEPIPLQLSLQAEVAEPALRIDTAMEATLSYDLNGQAYAISPLTLNATLSGPTVPGGSTDLVLNASSRVDLDADTLSLSHLTLDILGSRLEASAEARSISSDQPQADATVQMAGDDLAALFEVLDNASLVSQLRNFGNQNYSLRSELHLDMRSGDLNIPVIEARLLGTTIDGQLRASQLQTEAPRLNGALNASGPDLPLLIELAGQISGGQNAPLSQQGRALGRLDNKAFSVNTTFDADIEQGNIDLPSLQASALGLRLEGQLEARNMQDDSGHVDGQFELRGERLKPLLAALEVEGLSEVLEEAQLTLSVSGSNTDMRIAPFRTVLEFRGDDIPNGAASLVMTAESRINLSAETLQVPTFNVEGLGLNLSGELQAEDFNNSPRFQGQVRLAEFSPRQLLQQLALPLPETSDASTLQRFALTTEFNGSPERITVERLSMALDETTLNGQLALGLEPLDIRFDIDIDRINLDRYLPPDSDDDPADSESDESTELPIELLRELAVAGEIGIESLVVSGLTLNNTRVSVNADEGLLRLTPSTELYGGRFDGLAELNVQGEEASSRLDLNLSSVTLGPLLRDLVSGDYLRGTAQMELALTTRGNDVDTLLSSLNGNGQLSLTEGRFYGVDVRNLITQVQQMINDGRMIDVQRGEFTAFNSFSSGLTVREGVISTDNLLLEAPGFRVQGSGTLLDLSNETIAFTLNAQADRSTATDTSNRFDLSGYSIPISCSGSVTSPRCLPQLDTIVQAFVGREVERAVGDFLQRRLGGDRQTQSDGEDAAEGAEGEADAEQDPQVELINRALDRLFR